MIFSKQLTDNKKNNYGWDNEDTVGDRMMDTITSQRYHFDLVNKEIWRLKDKTKSLGI